MDDDFDRSQNWIPRPPDDDEDDYEDPNPRAMPAHPPERKSEPRLSVVDQRRAKQHEASVHIAEALKLIGPGGLLDELLKVEDERTVSITECPHCHHAVAPFYRTCPKCEGQRNRRKVERVAELVRELKSIAQAGDPDGGREREIIHQLREFDHPDLDGLERWCSAARDRAERAGAKKASSRW